jgi:S-DNA-T family DNA segregation ATPase FtsK/SpoIIIE
MNKYKLYDPGKLLTHLSQFIINSWSFSKLSSFSRNEKAFEMIHVYGYNSKLSATTVAGQAYHKALENYFLALKEDDPLDLVQMESIAFGYIEDMEAQNWKLQKTTPTVAECQAKANETASKLIKNFLKEVNVYLDDIAEILEVEIFGSEFVIINGVDIPLPCNFKIDLVVRTLDGKIAVIDHKSKAAYTSQEDISLSIGTQAITYKIGYGTMSGIEVDEVWFIENKYSDNRDKSPQLFKFKIEMDNDTCRLYEALLYESLKRMIQAVNDPDYVYIINDSDNLVDKAELYAHWTRTMMCEVEDFNVDPTKKEMVARRMKKIRDTSITTINPKILKNFNNHAAEFIQYDYSNKDMSQNEKIEQVLRGFGTIVKVAHKFDGYSSNTYLLEIGAGVKISSIQSHKLDLANALDVNTVRISQNLAVWEGKSYLAIEVAKKRDRDLIFDTADMVEMKIPIGKDNFGHVVYWDLANQSTPHALVCGSTGSGKSVSLKSSIEYAKPVVSRVIVLDPKFEFCRMKLEGVQVISDIEDIEKAMAELVERMNELVQSGGHEYTFIVFDEFADAQAQSRKGKELDKYENEEVGFYKQSTKDMIAGLPPQPKYEKVFKGTDKSLEENLRILLQKGRSVGFRIVAATQRASAKIITGDAKANFPVQICFRVPKAIDSQVVIDEPGAESLAGSGDGLIRSPEYPELVRFQAYYKP